MKTTAKLIALVIAGNIAFGNLLLGNWIVAMAVTSICILPLALSFLEPEEADLEDE